MLSFKQFLLEHIVNSFDEKSHHEFVKTHGDHVKSMISKSYEYAGGYGGHKTGSKEEHDAIHADLTHPNHIIKATKRDGKITSVNIYKNHHGRKSIAAATDGSSQGKKDFIKTKVDDIGQKDRHAWGEVSDKAEAVAHKLGAKEIPHDQAEKLTGKTILKKHDDGVHYDRKIGNDVHTKKIVGNPKI
jgi:hypothetical protein